MKYLKQFEKYIEPKNWYKDDEPKLYDYVILDINWYYNNKELDHYLNNTIGKISKIKKTSNNKEWNQYQILYDNPPIKLPHNRLSYVYYKQIKYFSSNKEELEAILNSKKYNL